MTTFNNPIRTLFSKKNTAPTTEKELLPATVSYHATPTANREPIRILLSEHAYVEAGISEGRPEALKNGLHHITSGHYIDSHMNEAQHDSQIEQLRLQREDIRSKKNEPEGILTNLLHNIIPALIQKIKGKKEEIAQSSFQAEEQVHQSGYSALRFWILSLTFAGLSCFIYLFYSSAIYSAFFRDVTTEINQATESNDFSALFNTVLNPYALLSGIPAVYLGPFLFFAFAIGWSLLYAKLKGKKGIEWLKHASIFTLFLGLAIAADFLIAWKIESFNHELKTMNGLASPDWKFYTEFMFWGVFILGLGSYVVWKMLTEAIIIEKDKVNPKRLAHLLREKLHLEIALLEEELLKHKEEEQKLLTTLKNLNNELNKIDIKLENIYKGVPDLVHSQDAYYRGWIKYVSSHPNKESLIEACEQVYHEFKLAMTPREHIEFIPRSLN